MHDDDQAKSGFPAEYYAYWADFAEAFAHPLTNNGLISKFITNPCVTGAYGEAWVQFMVKSMTPKFRVSTGAIIRAGDRIRKNLRSIPQCDLIIWDPSELPALFEQGSFALVPLFSVRAIIEVKRTCDKISELEAQLRSQQEYLPRVHQKNVLGVVISNNRPLFSEKVEPDWLKNPKWLEKPAITRLLSNDNLADTDGVLAFIYFLAQVCGHNDLTG